MDEGCNSIVTEGHTDHFICLQTEALFDNLAQNVDQNEGREEADLLQKLLCSLTSSLTSVKAMSDTSTANKKKQLLSFLG